MSGFALHPGALSDLEEIRRYIADDDPDAADGLMSLIFDRLRNLVAFPNQGFRTPELGREFRFLLVGAYLIAYRPDRRPIWVLAVIHGSRSPRVIGSILRGRR